MQRLVTMAVLILALAAPASASAFHHGSLPASACAQSDQASNNRTARGAILERNPQKNPGRTFPPFGTPGEGQGQAAERCQASRKP